MLLRNRHGTLPLSPGKKQPVYVAGSNADNIGNQAGGWTLTWQGGSTNVIPGQTVLDALRATSASRVHFSETASDPVPADAAGVVVVGETPYAEGFGDVNGPQWAYDPGRPRHPAARRRRWLLSDADRLAIRRVCSQAPSRAPSWWSPGRPMIIPPELGVQIDALVASWLPGSEGQGVADVLFGNAGRSPASCRSAGRARWPRSRSTSVTPATTRSTASASGCAPVGAAERHVDAPRATVRRRGSTTVRVLRTVLPDGEARDLYVVGGRVTHEPQAGAETAARAGSCPGLVDAHCHVGLDDARRGRRGTTEGRRSPTGTPGRCCCATAGRRPTPAGSTTARTCRG